MIAEPAIDVGSAIANIAAVPLDLPRALRVPARARLAIIGLHDPKLTPRLRRDPHDGHLRTRLDWTHRVWHDNVGTLTRYRIDASEAARAEDHDINKSLQVP